LYNWLPDLSYELRANLVEVYWLALAPLLLLLVILEFFKSAESDPNIPKLIKRALISVLLLVSFDETVHVISYVGDGVAGYVGGLGDAKKVLDKMWSFLTNLEDGWFGFKRYLIFVLSLVSYIFAYLGIFIVDALVHFCWAVLYICSPLMILAYIPESTSATCNNLYRSLCTVMSWKVLWAILGTLLLRLSTEVPIQDGDNYNAVLLVVVNLFIGASMLFIPFAAKSLMSDGLANFGSALAGMATLASKKAFTKVAKKAGSQNVKDLAVKSARIVRVPITATRRAASHVKTGVNRSFDLSKKTASRIRGSAEFDARGDTGKRLGGIEASHNARINNQLNNKSTNISKGGIPGGRR
jgi:hypothetical protein